ncbi:MAG: hypothetical protein ACFFD4_36545 [Candidatus Odinarchaeota archaeon]
MKRAVIILKTSNGRSTRIAKAVAEIRNSSPEEIKSRCYENVLKLIGNDSRLKEITKALNQHL